MELEMETTLRFYFGLPNLICQDIKIDIEI